ncbi:MAG: nicotinamide riboside transporter PnuC [Muribaculaceae bacterium]|nr:nicotinamide riboside transporter PnuC [Muribaculaceae bacterium]MDE5844349.1 nicotinamide riboside transporter PnuC [Muribaculaceae bacterium]MDE5857159.1 nicotinamide riboside transporter PnuC [Muribaculaceae bacterium]MDE7369684.1 nicotinamide riboside transporter PnuC [Muribaculaceae bacterium]
MLSNLPWDLILEILGFSVGVLYLWWEYHANSKLWFASIVMPTISMWIYLRKGIYADFAINIYYFLIAIYGYIVWTRARHRGDDGSTKKKELPITHIPGRNLFYCTALFFILWVTFYCVLRFVTDSSVPIADSFTTALSIVAMWMLARKYLEQWLAWVAVDAVCVGLYAYKGIFLYAVLYAVYTVIAFIGYRNWKRKMLEGS